MRCFPFGLSVTDKPCILLHLKSPDALPIIIHVNKCIERSKIKSTKILALQTANANTLNFKFKYTLPKQQCRKSNPGSSSAHWSLDALPDTENTFNHCFGIYLSDCPATWCSSNITVDLWSEWVPCYLVQVQLNCRPMVEIKITNSTKLTAAYDMKEALLTSNSALRNRKRTCHSHCHWP